MESPPLRRWRRVRLSVRALMVLVLVLAVLLGWYDHSARVQQAAIRVIKEKGGTITYDRDWTNPNPNSTSSSILKAPRWLERLLGTDYVAAPDFVNLQAGRDRSKSADDQTMEFVGKLKHMVILHLDGTRVTDAGLNHLQGMSRLSDLNLGGTAVTDAGLVHLTDLPELKTLSLFGTKVTDAGVLMLEEANPRLQIFREDNLQIIPSRPRALIDLTFAAGLPVRVAAPVLIDRAKAMNSSDDMAGLVATLDALCTLESDDVVDLLHLARARGECLGILEPTFSPSLSAPERQRLHKLCEARGIDALSEAVDRGYNNLRRLEGDILETGTVANLKSHPTYPKLIQAIKARRDKAGLK